MSVAGDMVTAFLKISKSFFTEFFELLNLTPKLLKTLFFGISPPTSEDTLWDPVRSFKSSYFWVTVKCLWKNASKQPPHLRYNACVQECPGGPG